MLQRQSDVENVYSKAISVSGTPALGATHFGSRLWCGYVAYKTMARLNVFYSMLCLTDFECGAFLKASMSQPRDSYSCNAPPSSTPDRMTMRRDISHSTGSTSHLRRAHTATPVLLWVLAFSMWQPKRYLIVCIPVPFYEIEIKRKYNVDVHRAGQTTEPDAFCLARLPPVTNHQPYHS